MQCGGAHSFSQQLRRMTADQPFLFSTLFSSGHQGRYGHEFIEFEFHADGRCRYANNSNYRNDSLIKKESTLS